MIAVSEAFLTAARATVRRTVPRVQITWTDPFIDTTIVASSNDDNYVTWPSQTADLNETPDHKWCHLSGMCFPDGNFYPAPSTSDEAVDAQMGWWGATRCNGSAVWAEPYPTLTLTFAARAVLGLLVVGDSLYNEYPVDFVVKIYETGNVLVHTETVTGNTLLRWTASVVAQGINDAVKIELIVSKWSAANKIVKITEFYTSVIDTYEGDDIVSMNILEEREIRDGSLPIGNISSNELDIELQNIRLLANGAYVLDPFFPSNTNSYLHTFTKKNRKLVASLGFELADTSIEYVQLGVFWSGDWDAKETAGSVSTSARDRLELLRQVEFAESPLYEDTTLYALATAILTAAKLTIPMHDLRWTVDEDLLDYAIPYAWFPRKSYMATLKDIAGACMGQVYMSKDDVLVVEGPVT